MNKTPLVSVVITTYNNAHLIKNLSLRSVLCQTYKNLEIIVGCDSPNSDIPAYLEKLGKSNIIYREYPTPNLAPQELWPVGGAYSRNCSNDISTGELIAPLDHDDIWGPTYVEDRVKLFLENESTEFIYSKAVIVANNTPSLIFGAPTTQGFTHGNNCIPHLTVMYRSELKKFKYLESGIFPADYALWLKMYENKVNMLFHDRITGIHNGKGNTIEFLEKVYKSYFNQEFKKIEE